MTMTSFDFSSFGFFPFLLSLILAFFNKNEDGKKLEHGRTYFEVIEFSLFLWRENLVVIIG